MLQWLLALLVFSSATRAQNCTSWQVGPDIYLNQLDVDFTQGASIYDLGQPSSNEVPRDPDSGIFVPANVQTANGSLLLIVNAYNGTGLVQCAQLVSNIDNILYASVRTEMMSSTVPGVGETSFFYANDQNEIDLTVCVTFIRGAFLSGMGSRRTSYLTTAPANGSAGIFYANAPHDMSVTPASETVASPVSPTAGNHTYRIDWLANYTAFYFDNLLQANISANVPTVAGPWMWSAWSDGNSSRVGGPPTQDSITRINRVTLYYNTSDDSSASSIPGQLCTVEDAIPSSLPSVSISLAPPTPAVSDSLAPPSTTFVANTSSSSSSGVVTSANASMTSMPTSSGVNATAAASTSLVNGSDANAISASLESVFSGQLLSSMSLISAQAESSASIMSASSRANASSQSTLSQTTSSPIQNDTSSGSQSMTSSGSSMSVSGSSLASTGSANNMNTTQTSTAGTAGNSNSPPTTLYGVRSEAPQRPAVCASIVLFTLAMGILTSICLLHQ